MANQDQDALVECMSLYGGLVRRLATRLLGNSQEDIEEATQDAFNDLWRHAHRFDPRISSEKTMVAMVARRRLIDYRRYRDRRPQNVPLCPEQTPSPAISTDSADTSEQLSLARSAISGLQAEHARALHLAIFEGWSHSHIARELGVPLGTIKTRIRRGLAKVRESLRSQSAAGLRLVEA